VGDYTRLDYSTVEIFAGVIEMELVDRNAARTNHEKD
jgi:hypothetical protein